MTVIVECFNNIQPGERTILYNLEVVKVTTQEADSARQAFQLQAQNRSANKTKALFRVI